MGMALGEAKSCPMQVFKYASVGVGVGVVVKSGVGVWCVGSVGVDGRVGWGRVGAKGMGTRERQHQLGVYVCP